MTCPQVLKFYDAGSKKASVSLSRVPFEDWMNRCQVDMSGSCQLLRGCQGWAPNPRARLDYVPPGLRPKFSFVGLTGGSAIKLCRRGAGIFIRGKPHRAQRSYEEPRAG